MAHIRKVDLGDSVTEYYMPYAMKTIVDRALPDVRDGLKPIHRRILYKMYEIGLHYNKERVKCHPIVGRVLEIHGHGDSSVYEAMAMLTNQNQTLLHPFIDGEGSFGKVYSASKPAASRYTYARLNKFSNEMFSNINKDVVDFIGDDYKQPIVLPSTFPNILIKPNKGMAVAFACNFPSFNFEETCDSTIAYVKDENTDLFNMLNIDFSTGGYLIYNEKEMRNIYETGRGKVTLRSKYRVDGKYIEIYEIPYDTTANAIIKKVNTLLLAGNKLKEIIDIRNESEFNTKTDKEELKLVIEVKKNTNVDLLMSKLFKLTPLESVFSCNMNCLVHNKPKTLGIKAILSEWLNFRKGCIKRSLTYDINKKLASLHNLKGLHKVLLEIDKVITIIRGTKTDDLIIGNLMKSFNIDDTQAEFIANIKLRNLNEQYILNKTKDIDNLANEIEELTKTLNDEGKIKQIIIEQLERVKNEYKQPRQTEIIYEDELPSLADVESIENYNTKLFITKDGYLKKISLVSLRGSGTQKLKDGDEVTQEIESNNLSDILIFTDKHNVYKLKEHELEDHKSSQLGEYLPSLLQLQDEEIVYVASTEDYKGNLLIGFSNGKVAKITLSSYSTKQNRSLLKNAYSDLSNPIYWNVIQDDIDLVALSDIDKVVVFNTSMINPKSSKNTQGVQIQKSKSDSKTIGYYELDKVEFEDVDYYTSKGAGIGKYLRKGDLIK